jgi:hypothetical protein
MAGTPIWPIEGVALQSVGPAVAGSLAYRVLRMYDDLYMPVSVYPTMAVGATVASAAGNWGLGNLSTVIPASTVLSPYLIQLLTVETLDKDGVFELVLYQGNADTEVARVRFSYFGGFFGGAIFRMPSSLVPASARIRAALAYSLGGGGAATITMSVAYRIVT